MEEDIQDRVRRRICGHLLGIIGNGRTVSKELTVICSEELYDLMPAKMLVIPVVLDVDGEEVVVGYHGELKRSEYILGRAFQVVTVGDRPAKDGTHYSRHMKIE